MTATVVTPYELWASATRLADGVKVVGHFSSDCTPGSLGDPDNANTWRCTWDPCFAPPGVTHITEVACPEYPYLDRRVQIVTLTKPVSSSDAAPPSGANRWPMLMELSDGEMCEVIHGTGEAIDGIGLNYGCDLGYASHPDASTAVWTVHFARNNSRHLSTLDVVRVWE